MQPPPWSTLVDPQSQVHNLVNLCSKEYKGISCRKNEPYSCLIYQFCTKSGFLLFDFLHVHDLFFVLAGFLMGVTPLHGGTKISNIKKNNSFIMASSSPNVDLGTASASTSNGDLHNHNKIKQPTTYRHSAAVLNSNNSNSSNHMKFPRSSSFKLSNHSASAVQNQNRNGGGGGTRKISFRKRTSVVQNCKPKPTPAPSGLRSNSSGLFLNGNSGNRSPISIDPESSTIIHNEGKHEISCYWYTGSK